MGKRIMVIEDEKHIAELIAYNLEANGYEVVQALDGLTGYQMILDNRPDLVVLDLMMPGISGLEVLQRMRANEAVKQIPVIMLTAKSSETDKIVGLEVGADDYVTKPFSVNELLARIKAHLRRTERERGAPPAESQRLIHGDLVIDLEKHEVLKDGESVTLSLKEFELLRVLLENRGRVMSRDQLLDKVWGYDYFGETRTVDVHVRHLRSKLDRGGESLIQTIRGIGYKIRQVAR